MRPGPCGLPGRLSPTLSTRTRQGMGKTPRRSLTSGPVRKVGLLAPACKSLLRMWDEKCASLQLLGVHMPHLFPARRVLVSSLPGSYPRTATPSLEGLSCT